ncbi:MAG: uL30 family ribosomal protein [Candidatus Pacearchaeota archaeon]
MAEQKQGTKRIVAVRIAGKNKMKKDIEETLQRLNLKDKYNCLVIEKSDQQKMGMIKKAKDFIAFGELDDETLKKLEESRSPEEKNIGKVFRLHPPRGGIDTKKHSGVGKGVLGNNKEKINQLLQRMI